MTQTDYTSISVIRPNIYVRAQVIVQLIDGFKKHLN